MPVVVEMQQLDSVMSFSAESLITREYTTHTNPPNFVLVMTKDFSNDLGL